MSEKLSATNNELNATWYTSPKNNPPAIEQTPTLDSHDALSVDGCVDSSVRASTPYQKQDPLKRYEHTENRHLDLDLYQNNNTSNSDNKQSTFDVLRDIVYISTFANFGSVLRIYLGRFFGLDCENGNSATQDIFTPFFSKICVTASGRTQLRGDVLFTDLPANSLGSFIIGVLSANSTSNSPLPWFCSTHHLQHHTTLQIALKVGFCGCLTSFSSWNTQMIVMMTGETTQHGAQIAEAVCGYLVGFACSLSSFVAGQHFSHFLRSMHSQPTAGRDGFQRTSLRCSMCREDNIPLCVQYFCGVSILPFVLLASLVSAFVVADVVYGNEYYQFMWMVLILTPLGALLRWKLSSLNRRIWIHNLHFVPWGTLLANVLACAVSSLSEAIEYHMRSKDGRVYGWTRNVLLAIQSGFTGGLSTVSTLVLELFHMDEVYQSYSYALITVSFAVSISLLLFSPVVNDTQ